MLKNEIYISVIGLGYVGLPLAIEFAKKFKVIGYDLNRRRVSQLKRNIDKNNEISTKEINSVKKNIKFTASNSNLIKSNFFIVSVPTPINKNNIPDLSILKHATKIVGQNLKKTDIVVFESTTYPGCTEEICLPILEKYSNLEFNKDFICGYSPERINPGDKKKKFRNIDKIISASNKQGLKKIKSVYQQILKSKLIEVENIKVAEAAKIIENTQRDINIALINELQILFNKMNINFNSVLKAANTKWNFLNFKPGLVGGHCIGVDPYYLAFKSKQIGYNPNIILAGRKINDEMSKYVVRTFIKKIYKKQKKIKKKKILLMGLTFKENVKDIRNSKGIEVAKLLKKEGMIVNCYDKMVNKEEIKKYSDIKIVKNLKSNFYDGILILLSHEHIKKIKERKILSLLKNKKNGVILDFKNIFNNPKYHF